MEKQIKLSEIDTDESAKKEAKQIVDDIYKMFDVITTEYKIEVLDSKEEKVGKTAN